MRLERITVVCGSVDYIQHGCNEGKGIIDKGDQSGNFCVGRIPDARFLLGADQVSEGKAQRSQSAIVLKYDLFRIRMSGIVQITSFSETLK